MSNTPALKSLGIEHAGHDAQNFSLELLDLVKLWFRFATVNNGKDFGQSLSACPKLTCLSAYMLWGLGGAKQKLVLPECRSISLDRSDDLYHLDLTAKLRKLELLKCYNLEYVRLLPREGSPVKVSIYGTDLNKASLKHLQQHPQVGRDCIKLEHPMLAMLAAMGFADSNDDMDMEDCDFTYELDNPIPS